MVLPDAGPFTLDRTLEPIFFSLASPSRSCSVAVPAPDGPWILCCHRGEIIARDGVDAKLVFKTTEADTRKIQYALDIVIADGCRIWKQRVFWSSMKYTYCLCVLLPRPLRRSTARALTLCRTTMCSFSRRSAWHVKKAILDSSQITILCVCSSWAMNQSIRQQV